MMMCGNKRGILWSLGSAGELNQARQQAELCLEKTADSDWLDTAGQPLKLRARQALWRIYSQLADILLDAADYNEAQTILHKGHCMATECRSTQSVYKILQIIVRGVMCVQKHVHNHITSTGKNN